MATKKSTDAVWEDIFDSLVLEAEPPQKYIKRVTIVTKDGHTFSLSPQDFAALIEQERSMPPGFGEIMSARMSLDFNRIKKDVDKWSEELLGSFDSSGKPAMPKFPKPKAGAPRAPRTKATATKVATTKPAATKAPVAKATKSKTTPVAGRKRPSA